MIRKRGSLVSVGLSVIALATVVTASSPNESGWSSLFRKSPPPPPQQQQQQKEEPVTSEGKSPQTNTNEIPSFLLSGAPAYANDRQEDSRDEGKNNNINNSEEGAQEGALGLLVQETTPVTLLDPLPPQYPDIDISDVGVSQEVEQDIFESSPLDWQEESTASINEIDASFRSDDINSVEMLNPPPPPPPPPPPQPVVVNTVESSDFQNEGDAFAWEEDLQEEDDRDVLDQLLFGTNTQSPEEDETLPFQQETEEWGTQPPDMEDETFPPLRSATQPEEIEERETQPPRVEDETLTSSNSATSLVEEAEEWEKERPAPDYDQNMEYQIDSDTVQSYMNTDQIIDVADYDASKGTSEDSNQWGEGDTVQPEQLQQSGSFEMEFQAAEDKESTNQVDAAIVEPMSSTRTTRPSRSVTRDDTSSTSATGSIRNSDPADSAVSKTTARTTSRNYASTKNLDRRRQSMWGTRQASSRRRFSQADSSNAYETVIQTTPLDEMPEEIPAFETRSSREEEDRKRTDSYNARQSAVDRYSTALSSLLRGNAPNVPPTLFGETLEQEVTACLLFRRKHAGVVGDGMDDASVTSYMRNARIVTDNAHQKLYGGAQYHRTMHHFHEALLATPLPDISTDEINLLIDGRSQTHDGSDLLRTVALLARHRIEGLVIQLLDELTCRVQYVLERLWDVVSYNLTTRPVRGIDSTSSVLLEDVEDAAMTEKVTQAYKEFVAWRARVAREKCVADVYALIRFVSWDLQYRRPSNPASGPIDGNAMARTRMTTMGI